MYNIGAAFMKKSMPLWINISLMYDFVRNLNGQQQEKSYFYSSLGLDIDYRKKSNSQRSFKFTFPIFPSCWPNTSIPIHQ